MASALSYKAITICGELWEDTQRRNAAPARATLPLDQSLSAGRTEEITTQQGGFYRACACGDNAPHTARRSP